MTTMQLQSYLLAPGDRLSRDEFIRRWEASPALKKAELIGGTVYMPSPVSKEHGKGDADLITLLNVYASQTPGCEAGANSTWFMLKDAPQPDAHLRISKEYGGGSWEEGHFLGGAPELAAEVCLSSRAYDLHQKKELYESAGVREYLALLLEEGELIWFRLVGGRYQEVPIPPDGVLRSQVFPGLWLDVPAFLEGDLQRVLDTLQRGLQSTDHGEFVEYLESRHQGKQ